MPAARTFWRRFRASSKAGGRAGRRPSETSCWDMAHAPRETETAGEAGGVGGGGGGGGGGGVGGGGGGGGDGELGRSDEAALDEVLVRLAQGVLDGGRAVAELALGAARVGAAAHLEEADGGGGEALRDPGEE